MSTKKNKNKVKNKPPTLQTKTEASETEKSELDTPIEEKTDLFKPEERVPEIVSEIVPVTTEVQVSEGDTPKKPKRNRGKKKKNEKGDECEDVQEQKSEETVKDNKCLGTKDVAEKEEIRATTPEVTPAARKKKNKNKKQEQTKENLTQDEIKIAPLKKGEELTDLKIVTVFPVETEESKSKKKNKKKKRTDSERSEKAEEVLTCTAAFQKLLETRDDKKDNKEVKLEMTQKDGTTKSNIQEEKEPAKMQRVECKVENFETVPEGKSIETKDNIKEEELGKSKKKNKKDKKHPPKNDMDDEVKFLESKIASEEIPSTVLSTESKDICKQEKDKPKSVENIDFSKIKEKSPKPIEKQGNPEEKIKIAKPFEKNIAKEEVGKEESQVIKQIASSKSENKPQIGKEKSPKPKAKIAKPVEKKQKQTGKGDASSTENLTETDVIMLPSQEKPMQHQTQSKGSKKSSQEPKIQTEPTKEAKSSNIEISEPKIIVQETVESSKILAPLPIETKSEIEEGKCTSIEDFGFIPVPEYGKNKKRKNSPKPKPSEIKETPSASTEEPKDVKTEPASIKDQVLSSEMVMKPKPDASEIQSVQLKSQELEILTNIQVQPNAETEKKLSKDAEVDLSLNIELPTAVDATHTKMLETPDTPKTPEIVKERTPEKHKEKQNIQPPESTSNKKRKKSPNPKKIDTPSENIKKSTDDVKNMPREQKEKTSPSMPSLEDIEIKSVKTDESEGFACDIVPDVQYPRASSQLQDDNNNNNTVIQEIKTFERQSNVPIVTQDTTLIQGSGETPIVTPEIIATVVKITEFDTTTSKDDKPTSSKTLKEGATPRPEEKTDLKSKVLDVNQGMEELRKSIERSLAELNAIERSEKDAEEQFSKAQAKLEAISDLAVKKGDDKRQSMHVQKVLETKEKQKEHHKGEIVQKTKDMSAMPIPPQRKEKSPLPSKKTETGSPDPTTPIMKSEEVLSTVKEKSPMPISAPITESVKIEQSGEKSPQPSRETLVKKPDLDAPVTKIEEGKDQPLTNIKPTDVKTGEQKQLEVHVSTESTVPQPPARKDNKGKGKKKKGKFESEQSTAATPTAGASESTTTSSGTDESKKSTQDQRKQDKPEQKSEASSTQQKGKQQSSAVDTDAALENADSTLTDGIKVDFEAIESFEDALTSSNEEDVNKSFEIIANEVVCSDPSQNPEINITAPAEDEEKDEGNSTKDGEKTNPVSQPKNLLGHPDIPARLNKTDYKKEKNKTPNTKQAKVRIKDNVEDPIEITKQTKESQTENKRRFLKDKTVTESISSVVSDNEEYVYKYSFRKVFLPSACHVCKKDLKSSRVPCSRCNLIFYCSAKHKDEDYPQHQGLCFAVSTIIHLKDQKHMYADAKTIAGHEYRLLRMQMIVSCEKVLKRRLAPWEQEALLYPRICADVGCREWRQNLLMDCEGCGQIAYCANEPTHLPSTHQRWCKSYSLYHKLVVYQQTKGRLEPRLPTRVLANPAPIPEKLNEVLAAMYEEKIDMTDIQYAALTQIATAPLTATFCQQLYANNLNAVSANGVSKKSSFTIHIVGADLQFEADALNKWEVFFLHLQPSIKELRVVLIGTELNPSKLPLDLLGKYKMCENCRQNKRRVLFDFQDKKTYSQYWSSDFITPDLVCAFNPSIHRSSVFNGSDPWPATVKAILKLKVPFVITAHTLTELQRDVLRIHEISEKQVNTNNTRELGEKNNNDPKNMLEKQVNIITEPKCNAFASVRPDRNFISDDEMPLLFNNFCYTLISGAF